MHVEPLEGLRVSPTACLFQGDATAVDASFFVTDHPPGGGPVLHVHPYSEVFLVQEGVAEFTAGDDRSRVEAGHVVVVPPDTPHRFENVGDGPLRMVSIHPSPTLCQTDLAAG